MAPGLGRRRTYAVGDSVLYSTDGEAGFAVARVVAVDQSVVPPRTSSKSTEPSEHGSDQAGAAAGPADGAAVATP